MPTGLLPTPAPTTGAAPTDPQTVAEAFMAALAADDLEAAMALADEDILYVNVGLPSIKGRDNVAKALGGLSRPEAGFEVYVHAISADGPVVLTERTDVLKFGRFRSQFWVWGRFDVHDGKITLWRDSFDFVDLLRAIARGLAGVVLPSLQPAPPELADPPGR